MTLVPPRPEIARTLPHLYLTLQLLAEGKGQDVPPGLVTSVNQLLKETAELRVTAPGDGPITSPDAVRLYCLTLTLPAAFGELLPESLDGVDRQLAEDLLMMLIFSHEDLL